ncbi:MAG TPA: mersacidin/lichenicidin family type 2 lantibiotic [Ktedonobacterales bacterium]|jgi:mersacidin/lichenicidin family type 2 lantibiotic
MSAVDIVRAWKDAEYRESLGAEEQALLPEHPAGVIVLADEDLSQAAGGASTLLLTLLCDFCTELHLCPVMTTG